MIGRALCRVGVHHWTLYHNAESGEPYTECRRCGAYTVTLTRGNKLPWVGL